MILHCSSQCRVALPRGLKGTCAAPAPTLRRREGLGRSKGGERTRQPQQRCKLSVVIRAAADDDEEIIVPKPSFQVRRLQPLPADYGSTKPKAKPRRKIPIPSKDASAPVSPPADTPAAATPAASPFSKTPPPKLASTPVAASQTSEKPAASPFASSPATPAASPFASPPAKSAASPFSNTGTPASGAVSPFAAKATGTAAKSPFGSSPSSPFGGSAPTGANPFDAPPTSSFMMPEPVMEKEDERPFWEKIEFPSLSKLFLVFTFSSIIALMLFTFYVVVQAGGVHFNDG